MPWLRRQWRQLVKDTWDQPLISPVFAALLYAFLFVLGVFLWVTQRTSSIDGPFALGVLIIVGVLMFVVGWEPIFRRMGARWRERREQEYRREHNNRPPPRSRQMSWFRDFGRAIALPVTVPDWTLVRVVAVVAGSTLRDIRWRYAVLGANLVPMFVVAVWPAFAREGIAQAGVEVPDTTVAFFAVTWAFLVILGVARRWAWIESDRELFMLSPHGGEREVDASQLRVRFDQDLRDEALVAFLFLFPLAAAFLMQFARASAAFEVPANTTILGWILFVAGELTKAFPFVDWAEVYGVGNSSPIEPKDIVGRHAVFVVRAIFDLLLIAGVVQGVQVASRIASQRQLFFARRLPLVDPFLERDLLLSHSGNDAFRRYDRIRLRRVVNDPGEVEVRTAAARVLYWSERASDTMFWRALVAERARHVDLRFWAVLALCSLGEKANAQLLIDILADKSEHDDVRQRVAWDLGELKARQSAPLLIKTLGDPTETELIRTGVASSLGRMGATEAVELLRSILGDASAGPFLRTSAARALGWLKDEGAVPVLMATLRNKAEDNNVRGGAAFALRQLGERQTVPLLVSVLDEPIDASLHVGVIWTIGWLRAHEAEDRLLRLLEDRTIEADTLRGWVATALGQMRCQRAVPTLIWLVHDQRERDWVRDRAIEALGEIGDQAAVSAIRTVFNDRFEQQYLRRSAAEALAALNVKAITRQLRALLVDTGEAEDLRAGAARSLARLGDVDCVRTLSGLVEDRDEDPVIRTEAALALGVLKADSARALLERQAGDRGEEPRVRAASVTALGRLAGVDGLDILRLFLQDGNVHVEDAAKEAIAEIETGRDSQAPAGNSPSVQRMRERFRAYDGVAADPPLMM